MIEIKLHKWQKEAIDKALDWFASKQEKPFLIDAAPGAGKTICASVIAKKLIDSEKIHRVIIIAPRSEIANQWVKEFKKVTGRRVEKITPADVDDDDLEENDDLCTTWQSIKGLTTPFKKICQTEKTFVICDEHHHASAVKSWGENADSAFNQAECILILTGTRIRSDGEDSVWFNDKNNQHPEEATYTISYGEAVDSEFCRPVTFARHQGIFSVIVSEEEKIKVSGEGEESDEIPKELKRLPGIQSSLNFYTLARTLNYERDGITPDLNSYQASMLRDGIWQLNDLRDKMPRAGGLVIAPNIKAAEYMAKILEMLEGEKPVLVHSRQVNSEKKIKRFRDDPQKKWLVSVAMISEGVDIPRLRVLIYLPSAQTELAFRQALGRVVRNDGPKDDTRAYFIIPRHKVFEEYAKRIRGEMSLKKRQDDSPKIKKCPICLAENEKNATECKECGHKLPKAPDNFKICPECKAENPRNVDNCQECEAIFGHEFEIELETAIRQGAIIQESEYPEWEVQESEAMADDIIKQVERINDPHISKIIRTMPKESWSRFRRIFNELENESKKDE